MGHHHARDGYDPVKVPENYRPLQRGRWTRTELEWLLRTHRDMPAIVAAGVREPLVNTTSECRPREEDTHG
jgi:hypothetical protein